MTPQEERITELEHAADLHRSAHGELKKRIEELEQRLAASERAAAQMRESLDRILEVAEEIDNEEGHQSAHIQTALSSDAGKGYERITRHSGDCHWWTYRICDCGYLMRANSHDFGEPSGEIIEQFLEHSHRIQDYKSPDKYSKLDAGHASVCRQLHYVQTTWKSPVEYEALMKENKELREHISQLSDHDGV